MVATIRKPGDRPVWLDVPTGYGRGSLRRWLLLAVDPFAAVRSAAGRIRLSVGFCSPCNGRANPRRFSLERRPRLDPAATQSARSRRANRPALMDSADSLWRIAG